VAGCGTVGPVSTGLLIDLDGVVRRWPPQLTVSIEERHRLPVGSIATAAFSDREALHRAVTGAVSDGAWRADIASRLAAAYGSTAWAAVREWSAMRGEVDAQVLDLVRQARRTAPVGLLTNATTRLGEDLAALGLAREFDAVVNSAEMGVAKPDPESYVRACARLGAERARCLFVDDTATHVAAARRVGLRGHVFRSVAELRVFLADSLHPAADDTAAS
jgi:putative hydrolase of the HAD superfamily